MRNLMLAVSVFLISNIAFAAGKKDDRFFCKECGKSIYTKFSGDGRNPAAEVITMVPGKAQEIGGALVFCPGTPSNTTKSVSCSCYESSNGFSGFIMGSIVIDVPGSSTEAQIKGLVDSACVQKYQKSGFASNCNQ